MRLAEALGIIEALRAENASLRRTFEVEIEALRGETARLRTEVARLQAENDSLREELRLARERMTELERAAARQAGPFRREESKKVAPEARQRPGRKPGHAGTHRSLPPMIDEEIESLLPERCSCGGELVERFPLVQTIEEIPPLRPRVVRLTTWQAVCSRCGRRHETTHPLKVSRAQGAAAVHLGPRATALATLLDKRLGLTCGQTCRVLRKGFGLSLSRGGLTQLLARVAAKVAADYEALFEDLRSSPAVFADETSWWVGGPGHWLRVFATPETTVYRVADDRSRRIVEATLGEDFRGMLVSDCLASYDPAPYRKHKCVAHHLRAIRQARDRPDTPDPGWLDRCKLLFEAVRFLYDARSQLSDEDFARRRSALERWLDALLAVASEQPGDESVRKRLAKRRDALLGCLYEPAAEPTNNRAERALRPAVIARKLSCGNRTPRGARAFEILASLAVTAEQRARDFVDDLALRLPLAPHAG